MQSVTANGLRSAVSGMASGAERVWDAVATFVYNLALRVVAPFNNWYVKTLGYVTLVTLFVTAFLNAVVPVFNSKALPRVEVAVSKILDRKLEVAGIRWVLPTGLLGITPLASVGPLRLGPSSLEYSHAQVPEAVLRVAPLASILQRAIVLRCQLMYPTVDVVQCSNFAWFGYPDDTTPSCRDFLPGLSQPSGTSPQSLQVPRGAGPGPRFGSISGSFLEDVLRSAGLSHPSPPAATSGSGQQPGAGQGPGSSVAIPGGAGPPSSQGTSGGGLETGKHSDFATASPPGSVPGARDGTSPPMQHTPATSAAGAGGTEEQSIDWSSHLSDAQVHNREALTRRGFEAPPTPAAVVSVSPYALDQSTGAVPSTNTSSQSHDSQQQPAQKQESPLSKFGSRVLQFLLPEVAIDRVTVTKGQLRAHIFGEHAPRIMKDLNVFVSLGKGYRTLELDIKAWACERDPANKKITMDNPHASVSLRPITPGAVLPLAGKGATRWYSIAGARTPRNALQEETAKLLTKMSELQRQDPRLWVTEDPETSPESQSNVSGLTRGVSSSGLDLIDGEESEARGSSKPRKAQLDQGPGGKLRVRLVARHIGSEERWPDMAVSIQGDHLHAPMIERLLPIPLDINEGFVTGELRLRAHNKKTWNFPSLRGRLHCDGLDFHFWDSPDSLSGTSMDMIFEGDRIYLHNASGFFGGVPLTLTGDMDINPLGGQYRLSASIPSVEVNSLRATLGARPLPLSLTGAIRGVLHCTGPLEHPVFSGTAIAIPPTKKQVEGVEESDAKAALLSAPGSVAAYDKVPIQSASAVFTFDTSSSTVTIHSFQAEPTGGGTLVGSGRLWVAPEAETDPRAVTFQAEGRSLPTESLLRRYLPDNAHLPPGVDMGKLFVKGTMDGSHVDAKIRMRWEVPASSAKGTADLNRSAITVTASAPTFNLKATGHTQHPSHDQAKRAVTQKEAKDAATPLYTGADVDVTMQGMDAAQLASDKSFSTSAKYEQPVRLKVSGRARFSGTLQDRLTTSSKAAQAKLVGDKPVAYLGRINLEGLRINQLQLVKKLTGELAISEGGLKLRAQGQRLDEVLEANLAMPLDLGLSKDLVPDLAQKPQAPLSGKVSLRRGQLHLGAQMSEETGEVHVVAKELVLDELEMGSLRGLLKDATLDCNLPSREGRGTINVARPRYNGLQGEHLHGLVQWFGDSIRLEKAVLQQSRSRYELEAECAIPDSSAIPVSPIDVASTLGSQAEGSGSTSEAPAWMNGGRWRMRMKVPYAELEEILPAARFLSTATSEQPIDYEKTKHAFIDGVTVFGQHARQLSDMLDKTARMAMAELGEEAGAQASTAPSTSGDVSKRPKSLPGLQELKGKWSGSVEAFGDNADTSNVAFNLNGSGWQGGPYLVDDVVARGSLHSHTGLNLQQFSVKAGDAVLLVQGQLMGPKQNAVVVLNDFPAVLLSPMLRSMPAFEHAVPAATAAQAAGDGVRGQDPGKRPWALARVSPGSQPPDKYSEFADSPVNGNLFVHGTITGTSARPQGDVTVKLFQGAIGPTRLSEAVAHMEIDKDQQMEFALHMQPADAPGHLKVVGKVPVPIGEPTDGSNGAAHSETNVTGSTSEPVGDQVVEIEAVLKDSGMMLLSGFSPDFRWLSGSADIALQVSGTLEDPITEGTAHISRGSMYCRYLKYPVTNINATVNADGDQISVEALDARVGKKGSVRVKGRLPINPLSPQQLQAEVSKAEDQKDLITLDANDLELRIRNVYTGCFDGGLTVRGSAASPAIGGNLRFSRGTAYLLQTQAAGAQTQSEPTESGDSKNQVSKAFTALTAGKRAGSSAPTTPRSQTPEAQEAGIETLVGSSNLSLEGLRICLGPDLRAVYPFVLNFGISGEVELNSPMPEIIRPSGRIDFENGDINLVATQLMLNRDHPNSLVFVPEAGMDPSVDMLLQGEDVRMLIQGPASSLHDHFTITYKTMGGETVEERDPTKIARIFEDQLVDAILADDGQIAFSNLAASAVSTVMPKMETHGQIGQARWRLVSAPSISGLLSLGPTSDVSNMISTLSMGTEMEIQFGKSFQAAMARKINKDNEMGTELTLMYNINDRVRMRLSSQPGQSQSLVFQYSGEGVPK